jgi:hypothetical protein
VFGLKCKTSPLSRVCEQIGNVFENEPVTAASIGSLDSDGEILDR